MLKNPKALIVGQNHSKIKIAFGKPISNMNVLVSL